MLESLDDYDGTPAAQARIREAFDEQTLILVGKAAAWLVKGGQSDRSLVGRAEEMVAKDPRATLIFDAAGYGSFEFDGRSFAAGRFSCRPLSHLLRSLPPHERPAKLQLFVLSGVSPLTDIGALQGSAPVASMFQVASQFNCLEAPGVHLVPVERYFFDPTQGPRASISAFPGTFLRHYCAPGSDGERFEQADPSPQLNLLHRLTAPGLAEVTGGYLRSRSIPDPVAFAQVLTERFEEIEVGVHEGVEVVLGANWDGPVQGRPLIGQVFTSTLAAGGYGMVDFCDPTWQMICRQLQRAAYLGTLAAAAVTGQRRLVLTLIGGGVFGNPIPLIWESILWACDQLAPRLPADLTVIVNGRELPGLDRAEVTRSVQKRGGDLLMIGPGRSNSI